MQLDFSSYTIFNSPDIFLNIQAFHERSAAALSLPSPLQQGAMAVAPDTWRGREEERAQTEAD